ncbi:GtrA-like protein [Burkholderia sp. H160]|nr:GtrA-like protein [Burkholderia sp. H160]
MASALLKSIRDNQFLRFLAAGGAAAMANFLSRFFFSRFMSYVPAITLAFLVGLLTGFVLMRAFVFLGPKGTPARQLSYFVAVNVAGLLLTIVVSVTMARAAALVLPDTQLDEGLGHLIGVASPVLLSFYAHKHFTFR